MSAALSACEHDELGLVVGDDRAGRGGRPQRPARHRRRHPRAPHRADAGQRHGLGARDRGAPGPWLSDGDTADALYQEAVERLASTAPGSISPAPIWCTASGSAAEQRRSVAREHLRVAHDMFSHAGVAGFAERARRELSATGETVRRRTVEPRTCSPRRRRRSRSSRPRATPTPRSAPSCASAGARPSTTSARCSPSSPSARAGSSAAPWTSWNAPPRRQPAAGGTVPPGNRLGTSTEAIAPVAGGGQVLPFDRGAQP